MQTESTHKHHNQTGDLCDDGLHPSEKLNNRVHAVARDFLFASTAFLTKGGIATKALERVQMSQLPTSGAPPLLSSENYF
jgi:hypothetical protein